ncbi:MAG: TolC family protein [Flavobacteriales bacterium]|nr:TolC family protein [Flavobacteriales bacterium]
MNHNFNIIILIISLAFNFQLKAQNNPLTFQKLLNDGFENNYDIKLEKLSLTKADYTLLKAKGALNPFVNTILGYGAGIDPSFDNDGTEYLETKLVVPTKFGIYFYTGFRLESTIELDDPNYSFNSSGAFAGAKIPLLKGIGKNSQENTFIEVSKINQKVLGEQFSNQILTYFRELLINYLTLKEAIEEYEITKSIVSESIKYKNGIYALAENDQIPLVEKNRANSFYIDKLQELTISSMQVLEVYYNTKTLLGIDDNEKFDSIPELMDEIPDPNREKLFKYITTKKIALDSLVKNTPQYKSISLGVDENEILLNNAKNQKKNLLDLDIRVSSFGTYEEGAYNLHKTFNSNPGNSVLLTLTHNFPIKNQQQKGAYLEQLVEYDLSKTDLKQYLFESTTSVELHLKLLKQQIDLFGQTKLLVDLLKINYQDEMEKFKLGNSTQTEVIINLDNYFEALNSLNTLKYNAWKTYVGIKFILGELPKNVKELSEFLLSDFFSEL